MAKLGLYESEAIRWSAAGGTVGLGDLPGGAAGTSGGTSGTYAWGVSADGSIITGSGITNSGHRAFVWDEVQGIRLLDEVLTGLGLDVTGWTLGTAMDVSDDGLTFIGNGTNPLGQEEAWIATIPEPTTAHLMVAGVLGLAYRQRRLRRAAATR